MADEDKEKAEKVAAARKRYEELKKQKAKKGDKKKGAKKEQADDDKPEDAAAGDDDNTGGAAGDDDEQSAALAARVDELEKSAADGKAELESSKAALAQAEKRITELTEQAESREKELLELNKEAEDSEREAKEFKKKIAAGEKEVQEATSARDKAEALAKELQGKLKEAEDKAGRVDGLNKQIADLKKAPSKDDKKDDKLSAQLDEQTAANKKLEQQVSSLQGELEQAQDKATSLEKQLQESKAADGADREKEANGEEKTQLLSTAGDTTEKFQRKKSVDGDDGGLADIEDEERQQLQARVRELEDLVYQLRRGKPHGGQADEDALASPGAFSDVDLNSASGSQQKGRRQSGGYPFSNVINAFTGGSAQRPRGQSGAGFLEEDDLDFDENAFKMAQEDEAKSRLERVRETKRGLSLLKGNRLDLVELRGGAAMGVFDI